MKYGTLLKEYFVWHYVSVVKCSVLQAQTAHCINKHNAKSSVQVRDRCVETPFSADHIDYGASQSEPILELNQVYILLFLSIYHFISFTNCFSSLYN